jgi:hypothetical protein
MRMTCRQQQQKAAGKAAEAKGQQDVCRRNDGEQQQVPR